MEKFERIFNPTTIVVLNVIIIISAIISGTSFLDTGLIHGFAIFFILLSVIRIFVRHYSYDQFLEKFFNSAVIMFLILALPHFVEFVSSKILHLASGVTFANVANFYIIGLLILTIGAEKFLHLYDRRSSMFLWILSVIAAAFIVPIIGLYLKETLFKPDEIWLYIYIATSIAVAILAMVKIGRIGKLVSISNNFVKYMRLAIILVTSSILVNIFYDILENSLLKSYQINYISHFLFYAGLSLIFLAFGTLKNIEKSGLYRGSL